MHVDADSLEQLNLRTRDGAEQAGNVLTDHLGEQTRIGTTNITLASYQDLVAALLANSDVCLEFDLEGALSGTAILAFDDSAQQLVGNGTIEAEPETAISDFGVELIDAFVTEWGDHVGETLSVDVPTYVKDLSDYEFAFESISEETDSTALFEGQIDVVDDGGRVTMYLIPDVESLETLLSVDATGTDDGGDAFGMDAGGDTPSFGDDDDDQAFGSDDEEPFGSDDGSGGLFDDDEGQAAPIPLDKLSVFSDLTRAGTTTAAERVTQMSGAKTTTEISGINFRPIDDISSHLDADSFVGTTVEFTGKPSGNLVIMFPEKSARRVAEAMLPMEPDGEGVTEMHESALEELGNLMTSGFIDGWANVLERSVDHTPPMFTDDIEMTMLELVTDQLGPFQTHAYTIESRIAAAEIDFTCEIHALPDESDLSAALDELLVDRKDQVEADPDDVF